MSSQINTSINRINFVVFVQKIEFKRMRKIRYFICSFRFGSRRLSESTYWHRTIHMPISKIEINANNSSFSSMKIYLKKYFLAALADNKHVNRHSRSFQQKLFHHKHVFLRLLRVAVKFLMITFLIFSIKITVKVLHI